MAKITFLPANITYEAAAGDKLSDVAVAAGVTIALPCAGRGMCGKCLVKVSEGSVDFTNNGKLSSEMEKEGYVLACKSTVKNEDITVELPDGLSDEEGSFANAQEHIGISDYLFPKAEDLGGYLKFETITVDAPEMLDGLGDYDRLKNAFSEKTGKDISLPISILRKLPNILREKDGEVCVWYREEADIAKIIDIRSEKGRDLGAAVDIGTTTVAVAIVDMNTGKIITSATNYNAQIERGLDVISRIAYAKNEERIEEMRKYVVDTINDTIAKASKRLDIKDYEIRRINIAANTTMTQLFLGIVPDYIRLEPYTPAVMGSPVYSAKELGVKVNENAHVVIAPNVGSYVGGDITAGILCTDFAVDSEEMNLFIDIGTNGEIVFGNSDFLLSCACSAGPAFEGGGIEMGMRASVGAIETVIVNYETGENEYKVIGNGTAKGICGSGLISLVAQLYEAKIIDPRGKMDTSGKWKNVVENGKNSRYYIAPEDGDYKGVYITEIDIDNLIRAKAAIFSACLVMLKSVEMDFDCLSHIYIAGGFGRYIDVKKAKTIGLLPNLDEEKFVFIGNSSLAGTHMCLVSEKHEQKMKELASKITYMDLSTEVSYMDEYVSAMFIPHTNEKLFAD